MKSLAHLETRREIQERIGAVTNYLIGKGVRQ